MKIWLRKLINNPIFRSVLSIFILGIIVYFVFKDIDNNETILAAINTGLVVMVGYFVTHYLIIYRKQREKKFEQCLELIKKIRFFILEKDIKKNIEQRSKMRDDLQDAYFAFSLLTSEKSYKALSEMMNAFKSLLKDPNELCHFKKAQSKFVNELRKEFFVDKEIDFETYDFRLEEKK